MLARGPRLTRGLLTLMIQAIFFDFNGVIIDDERIHLKTYRDVLAAEGVELTDDDYFASLGMDDAAFVRAAYKRAGKGLSDEDARRLIDREHELHREMIKNDLPVPAGAIAFIKEAARQYDLGIVSMAERSEIEHVLELAGIKSQFSLIVNAEPDRKHKPAPDCYQDALELLNQRLRGERRLPLLGKECLVIEDSPPGIESARAAGMRTIGVTTTVNENALRQAGADVVTHNLSDWTTDAVHHLFD
jgi:beta-phosphoglucomutase